MIRIGQLKPNNVVRPMFLYGLMGITLGCGFEFNRTFDNDASPVVDGTGNTTAQATENTVHDAGIPTEPVVETQTASPTDTHVDTGEAMPDIENGTLEHRWRFNGHLEDDVGASHANIITPAGAENENATFSNNEILLAGGAFDQGSYVSLGTNLLTNINGPLTVELFATQLRVTYFARIFQFGAGLYEYINMTWCRDNEIEQDAVIWWGGEDMTWQLDTNAPYRLGEEYHIVMTIDPYGGEDTALRIVWYTAPSSASTLGAARGSIETPDRLTDLDDSDCWLGKSHSDDDWVANASYNEVRIWSGVLSESDLETLHTFGTSD